MPSGGGNSCLDEQIERLKRCEYLREGEVKALCLRAREILVDESNVQRVDAPVTVSLYIILLCLSAYLPMHTAAEGTFPVVLDTSKRYFPYILHFCVLD